jgi:hypothetical protein
MSSVLRNSLEFFRALVPPSGSASAPRRRGPRPSRPKSDAERQLEREMRDVFAELPAESKPRNLARLTYGEGTPTANLPRRVIEATQAGASRHHAEGIKAAFNRFVDRVFGAATRGAA